MAPLLGLLSVNKKESVGVLSGFKANKIAISRASSQ